MKQGKKTTMRFNCMLLTPEMVKKEDVEFVHLDNEDGWNPLKGSSVLGNTDCIDHLSFKWGQRDGNTCVTFFWDGDAKEQKKKLNHVAVKMISELVRSVPRFEPLTDCRRGNVVVCFTDQGSGVDEETGVWCSDMPDGPHMIDYVVNGIRKGVRADWFSIPDMT